MPYIWYVDKDWTHSLEDLEEKMGHIILSLFEDAFIPKKYQMLAVFAS